MKNITEMTAAEMIAEYNALTGKSTKKFSSRAAGERQLAAARANDPKQLPTATEEEVNHLFNRETNVTEEHFVPELGISHCPHCGIHLQNGYTTNTAQRYDNQPLLDKHEYMCLGCGEEFGPLIKGRSAKRSHAIARSWFDAEVAAKRSRRDHVAVNGVEYRSVLAAFKALNLPIGQHIKFRMALKEAGTGVYEHDGKEYEFNLVPKGE